MEKEVFGSIYIQFLSIGIRNISGNGNDIAIAEPVAGDFQLPGLRITAHPVIMNLIIIGNRRTNDFRQRVLLSRRDRYIHAALFSMRGKDRAGRNMEYHPNTNRNPNKPSPSWKHPPQGCLSHNGCLDLPMHLPDGPDPRP